MAIFQKTNEAKPFFRHQYSIACNGTVPPSPPILLQYRITHVTLTSSSISEALLVYPCRFGTSLGQCSECCCLAYGARKVHGLHNCTASQ